MKRNKKQQPKAKSKEQPKYVEYVVQDCPICGRKVVRHWLL